jgi:putative MATE family efflux protein
MAIQLSDHFTYAKLLRFVLPSIGTMIFTSIYGVVDGLFVSNFIGKTAFAAVNLVYPFLMVLGAVGFMLGSGGTALVAKTLGEGKRELANRYFSMVVTAAFFGGVLSSLLGFAFMRPIVLLLGAAPAMVEDCVLYGRIVIAFNAAFMLQLLFQTFFVTAEKARLGLRCTVAAGLTNMVLDAVFVGLFRWGVAGAAVATGISQCIGGLLPLAYFARENGSLLRLRPTAVALRPVLMACANGSSEMLSTISGSLVGMVYNAQLMHYAGEDGVAAYGVLMYVNFTFSAAFIGYTIGCSPIVSYHYGAGNRRELKNVLGKSLVLMGISGLGMTLLAEALAVPIAAVFVGYDPVLMALTRRAFFAYSFSFLLVGFNIFTSAFFTALNNGAVSAAVSFLRTLVFELLSVLLLPLFFGLDGIWWAILVAEGCAFLISTFFLLTQRKKYGYA